MERAIELAARGAGTALPNTVVGCVLLSAAGRVVGEWFHERAGGPHAEVIALQKAGAAAAGATAVVTLEPCDRTGRTGPCSKALIDAGVTRIVRKNGRSINVSDRFRRLEPDQSSGTILLRLDAIAHRFKAWINQPQAVLSE